VVGDLIVNEKVIIGLGETGLSVAKFLASRNQKFKVIDSRSNPPALSELKRILPEIETEVGELKLKTLLGASELVISPGLSLKTPVIAEAAEQGVAITGDIDIFSKSVSKPIIAVTGSNGKSTVVAILARILEKAGKKYGLGGNLDGTNFKPALDLLSEAPKDFYILELSSFQLETTEIKC